MEIFSKTVTSTVHRAGYLKHTALFITFLMDCSIFTHFFSVFLRRDRLFFFGFFCSFSLCQ